MVGGESSRGGAAPGLTASLREAYGAAAPAWTHGAERVYLPLAHALVGEVEVTGRRVLDLGAGTGVAGRGALAAGARRVVAADLAVRLRPPQTRRAPARPATSCGYQSAACNLAASAAGHDAWVAGDEPEVVVDWWGASSYART